MTFLKCIDMIDILYMFMLISGSSKSDSITLVSDEVPPAPSPTPRHVAR